VAQEKSVIAKETPSGLVFVAMTSKLSDWPLTMNVVVRDRAAELPNSPVVTRAVTISAFCRWCCIRRGP